MNLSVDGFRRLCETHVVEALFTRRHEKAGWPWGRRILCTLDRNLLLSLPGRVTLNFYVPTHPPAYIAKAFNLVVTWDIMWQAWRAIPVESLNIISALPTHTKADQGKFWTLFAARLAVMTPQEKMEFMKSRLGLYLDEYNTPSKPLIPQNPLNKNNT